MTNLSVRPQPQTQYQAQPVGVSRRGFLQWCGYLASALALPPSLIPRIAQGLERRPRYPVIWFNFQSCCGCTESLSRAYAPTLESLIFDFLSLDFHSVLQAAAGNLAEEHCRHTIEANRGHFLLVVEGAVPLGMSGAYSTCGGISNLAQLAYAAEGAAAVIAVGSCAAFGGLPKAHPNPTRAQGIGDLMVAGRIPRRPLANIPGCPPLPEAIATTLAHVVVFEQLPARDALDRPLAFYGHSIHERCSRLSFFQQGRFALSFDDEGARQGWCLFKLGCKGPATHNACAQQRWNGGLSFPVESGHPCLGCSEPDFWDAGGFYRPLRANLPLAAGRAG
jgi:hydrogenase small subunit